MFFCLFCSADLCWFWNSSFVQPQCHRLHNSASSSSCSCSGSVPRWDWCPHLPHHFSHLCHWRSRGRGPDRRRGELDPRGSEWWGCTKDLVSLLVFFFWCWGRNKDIMVKNDKQPESRSSQTEYNDSDTSVQRRLAFWDAFLYFAKKKIMTVVKEKYFQMLLQVHSTTLSGRATNNQKEMNHFKGAWVNGWLKSRSVGDFFFFCQPVVSYWTTEPVVMTITFIQSCVWSPYGCHGFQTTLHNFSEQWLRRTGLLFKASLL